MVLLPASLQKTATNKGVVPTTLKIRTRILAQSIKSTQKPNKNYTRTNNKLHKNNTYNYTPVFHSCPSTYSSLGYSTCAYYSTASEGLQVSKFHRFQAVMSNFYLKWVCAILPCLHFIPHVIWGTNSVCALLWEATCNDRYKSWLKA